MKSPHLLNVGNPRKVKENLSGILDVSALGCIEAEIERNVLGLLALASLHYSFASRLSPSNWRQKTSRLYYAAHNAGRALRLYLSGDYSTDVKDHQKLDKIPDNFPSRSRYINQLTVLREDRNTCDYDHVSTVSDLVLPPADSAKLVEEFLRDVRLYLRGKGLNTRTRR